MPTAFSTLVYAENIFFQMFPIINILTNFVTLIFSPIIFLLHIILVGFMVVAVVRTLNMISNPLTHFCVQYDIDDFRHNVIW